MIRILGFVLCCAMVGFTQSGEKKTFEPKIVNSELIVEDTTGKIFFEKKFNDPSAVYVNLSNDNTVEYLIRDKKNINGAPKYVAFIYSITDSFYLIDSVYSGVYEPAPYYSTELEKTLLLVGNLAFDSLYFASEHEYFSAVTCLQFEDGTLFNVDDLVYDVFIQENEPIISFIESSWSGTSKDCTTSTELKSAIAAVYLNYLNAGEKVLARQFFNDYYLCSDKELFKSFLDSQ